MPPEINKTPGLCGGEACIRDSRIAVWTLVQLKKLGRNRSAFLFDLTRQDGSIMTVAGYEIPRLPSCTFWLDDGDFCGVATLRFVSHPSTFTEPV